MMMDETEHHMMSMFKTHCRVRCHSFGDSCSFTVTGRPTRHEQK